MRRPGEKTKYLRKEKLQFTLRHRIECVCFFALMERELRRAMQQKEMQRLLPYPVGRAYHRPTARKVIDLYEDVQRHCLRSGTRLPEIFGTGLTHLQRRLLRVLGTPKAYEI